jgi:amino acid transporter
MSDMQIQKDLQDIENKLSTRYSRLSKLSLFITILLIIGIVFIFFGTFILKYGYNWAFLNINNWIITISIILILLIIFELVFYFHFSAFRSKRKEQEKPKPEYIKGKRVHVFTHPKGKEGGIFSKTYIEIDEHTILRLRTLMILPEELWGKKE